MSRTTLDRLLMLERLGASLLLVVDEVDYIPFDPEAAALFFALVRLTLRAPLHDLEPQTRPSALGGRSSEIP